MRLHKQIQKGFHDFYTLDNNAERISIKKVLGEVGFKIPFDIYSFNKVYVSVKNINSENYLSGILAVLLSSGLDEIFTKIPSLNELAKVETYFNELVDLVPKSGLVANIYLATINSNDSDTLQSLLLGSRSLPIDMMFVSRDNIYSDNNSLISKILFSEGYERFRSTDVYTYRNNNAALFEHAFD